MVTLINQSTSAGLYKVILVLLSSLERVQRRGEIHNLAPQVRGLRSLHRECCPDHVPCFA